MYKFKEKLYNNALGYRQFSYKEAAQHRISACKPTVVSKQIWNDPNGRRPAWLRTDIVHRLEALILHVKNFHFKGSIDFIELTIADEIHAVPFQLWKFSCRDRNRAIGMKEENIVFQISHTGEFASLQTKPDGFKCCFPCVIAWQAGTMCSMNNSPCMDSTKSLVMPKYRPVSICIVVLGLDERS